MARGGGGGSVVGLIAVALVVVCGLGLADAIWPLPVRSQFGTTNLAINTATFKVSSLSRSAILQNAIGRYNDGIFFPFKATGAQKAQIAGALVTVKSDNEDLHLKVDESYNISVSNIGAALITANTIYGAMHGIETFAQLIVWNETTSTYSVPNTPISIRDQPRFPWRGLLIDSARHYLNVDTIKKAIDAMSYGKFNTLHWHLVDAQSWPVESKALPQLTKAAFSPSAVFTASDIREVVEYAKARGVRVVPEFEMPGHAATWGVGYPNTTAKCARLAANINNVALNPANEFVYSALRSLLTEMTSPTLFTDSYLHVGGDEVVFGCWLEDPSIVAWMKSLGLANGQQVYNYFETRLFRDVLHRLPQPRDIVVWQEVFTNNLNVPKNTTIEVWISQDLLAQVLKAGYPGILAAGYYLDKQIPNPAKTWYEWVDTWKNFYENEPLPSSLGLTVEEESRFLGGEAAMWGEQVDSTNFVSRVFPRSYGTAERLWSEKSVTDVSAAVPRLVDFRCRVAQRGIEAGPVASDWCPLP
eukprot:TRINITY_DN2359_c0_g1_i1.p1 TRINITY_DN2359_c0_g1~~TRINITY_DN2359_c0_g1_i1.p1  ORF type:complete len:529 (-),score=69.71 TRINITY_DN2359_c0_g1_i1:52-1638(-)